MTQNVYLLGTVLLLVSVGIASYLREIPLRKSNQPVEEEGSSALVDGGLAG